MKHTRIAMVAAVALMAAACGSDGVTNAIDTAISGTLSFSYSGGGGGTFNATGGITSAALASSPYTTTWAAGFKDASDNSTNIAGNIPRTSTTSDVAVVTVKGQSTGNFAIDVSCVETSTSTCNSVILLTGWNGTTNSFTNTCVLTSGSITISTLSSTNAVGTFTGSGTCGTQAGSFTTWIVTNGSFSVPLLANVPSNLP